MQAFFTVDSCIEGPKGILGRACDGRSNTGLANPWWAKENHGRETIGLHHAADDFPWADQVFLSDDLINGFGAHAQGEIVRHEGLLSSFVSFKRGSFYGKIVVTIVSYSALRVGN